MRRGPSPCAATKGAARRGESGMLDGATPTNGAHDPAEFEAAFAQLEECVAVLEQGGLTLDVALARFEDGMRLSARCAAILDEAELRVTRLLAANDDEDDEPAF